MITFITKIFATVLSKFFYAFFTEKLLSKLIIELLKMLSKRTTNSIDDIVVRELEQNMKI